MVRAKIRRKLAAISRKLREARMFARAMSSPLHPFLAHVVPIRRCNLACAYCNEFDAVSPPVPLPDMLRRIDRLAELGTAIITLSGGEPLLHPHLDRIIERIRRRGLLAALLTNGYPLTPARIARLNRAGLDYLQISIDNLYPDDVSKKSLSVLERKLRWLADCADFSVTINTVLGDAIPHPEHALHIARRARDLGFTSTTGFIHDHRGQFRGIDEQRRRVYEDILRLGTPLFSFAHYDQFQKSIARDLAHQWHCRAGARYLYVCEDGLVHWCSQQRGRPAIPLEQYSRSDLEHHAALPKPCAAGCSISCAHQVAMLDSFREWPRETLLRIIRSRREIDPSFRPPLPLSALQWMFLDSSHRRALRRLALRALGLRRGG